MRGRRNWRPLEEEQIVDTSDLFLTHNQYTTLCSEWLAAKSAAADEIARQAELEALEEEQMVGPEPLPAEQRGGGITGFDTGALRPGMQCAQPFVLVSVDGGLVTSPPLDWHSPAPLPQKQPAWLQIGRSKAAFLAVRVCVLAGYV